MREMMIKVVSCYLIGAMFVLGIVPRVYAGFSPSDLASFMTERASDLQTVQKALETKMIKERLKDLGFSGDDIHQRLSGLSDAQVHQLALNLDQLKVGGDATGAILVVILLLMLIGAAIVYLTNY